MKKKNMKRDQEKSWSKLSWKCTQISSKVWERWNLNITSSWRKIFHQKCIHLERYLPVCRRRSRKNWQHGKDWCDQKDLRASRMGQFNGGSGKTKWRTENLFVCQRLKQSNPKWILTTSNIWRNCKQIKCS